MHVIIAGGSGFVGGHLAQTLISQRHQVTILTHSDIAKINARMQKHFELAGKVDILTYEDYNGEGDVLVNFAGESIGAKPITSRRLSLLLSSRLDVIERFKKQLALPPVYIQASAVSLYDEHSDAPQDERSPANGTSEIANLAKKLEEASNELNEQFKFDKYYIARFGIVMHRSGGFIKKAAMTPPFRVIHGDNKIAFIELSDAVNAMMMLCDGALPAGPVNLVSPKPATLQEVLKCCFKHSKLPPIPIMTGFLRLSDRRMQLLSCNQNIQPHVLVANGFTFTHPDIATVE